MDKFDRVVFESIVEKVIVGETNDDGTVDPFKLTFVITGGVMDAFFRHYLTMKLARIPKQGRVYEEFKL